jgi:enamine deaminase RidA (YjgF/YER057c/UK114 family)
MQPRTRISSNSPYEATVGYSRAVRVGDTIYVAGTVAWGDDGKIACEGDMYGQARQVLRNIEKALKQAGASLEHVVQTRMYLTDISRIDEAGRAHGEVFGEIRPACTGVEVSALVEPSMLIEIEAIAVL